MDDVHAVHAVQQQHAAFSWFVQAQALQRGVLAAGLPAAGRPAAARGPAHPPGLGPRVRAAGAGRTGTPRRAAPGGRRARRVPQRRGDGLHPAPLLARPGQPDAAAGPPRRVCAADPARHHHPADQVHAGERARCRRRVAGGRGDRMALFDLDHTLLPIDSDYSWGEFTQQIGWTDPVEFKRRNDAFYEHYLAGTLDVHDYVRFAVEALRAARPARPGEAHARFMREVDRAGAAAAGAGPGARPPAARRHGGDRHRHQRVRHAPDRRGLRRAGADRGASWSAMPAAGSPARSPACPPCARARWCAWRSGWRGRGLDWLDVETTFYSDSINDLPLLERVDHPVATNPDAGAAHRSRWNAAGAYSTSSQ